MRKSLILLAVTAILSSCGFSQNQQEDNGLIPSILKEITSALSEEQEEAVEAAPVEESVPTPAPKKEGKWYDRDFALCVIGHSYSMNGTLDKGSDVRWYLTRIGNTVYQHTVESSGTIVDTISEFTDGGKRNVRQFANGALRKSYTDDADIHKYVYNWLTHEDHNVMGSHPDSDYAQSTGTFSGRACKIIETEKEENLLGVKKRTIKQYYVDSEYDFLLKVCKSGSGAGLTLNDIVLWEVSSFTDIPTEKDIYRK